MIDWRIPPKMIVWILMSALASALFGSWVHSAQAGLWHFGILMLLTVITHRDS